jgi:hypothetical protein
MVARTAIGRRSPADPLKPIAARQERLTQQSKASGPGVTCSRSRVGPLRYARQVGPERPLMPSAGGSSAVALGSVAEPRLSALGLRLLAFGDSASKVMRRVTLDGPWTGVAADRRRRLGRADRRVYRDRQSVLGGPRHGREFCCHRQRARRPRGRRGYFLGILS